jgi:hypothetical protein
MAERCPPAHRAEFAGPVYEYACHEGNYGMELILADARAQEKKAEEAAKNGSKQ